MIITGISGGLGNQMFQYATGRAVALQKRIPLKLDISGYADDKFGRHYSLDVFNIRAEIAQPFEVDRLKPHWNFITKKSPKIQYLIRRFSKTYVNESISKGKIPLDDNLYLDGYWQDEIYFRDIKEVLYRDFTLKKRLGYKDGPEVRSVAHNLRR